MDASKQDFGSGVVVNAEGSTSCNIMKDRLTSLPADVLHHICRAAQLQAVTALMPYKRTTYAHEWVERAWSGTTAAKPGVVPLRLACKALRVANDCVRTSIRYSVEEVGIVQSYLRKLPNLNSVCVDWDDAEIGAVSSCLHELHSIAPGLERLEIRYNSIDEDMRVRRYGLEDTANANGRCLLPWHPTLRHLELHNIDCTDQAFGVSGTLNFLSQLPMLQTLELDNVNPGLAPQNLAGCTSLQQLHITKSKSYGPPHLSALDLSACKSLRELHCVNCDILTLDVSACEKLEILDICRNKMQVLHLSTHTALKKLLCSDNLLERLDLTGCIALEEVELSRTPINTLYVAGCTALTTLRIDETQLAEVDLSRCSSLTNLITQDSPLTRINFSGCSSLKKLKLHKIKLQVLDLTGLSRLKTLWCSLSTLTTVELTGCTALIVVHLESCIALASLKLSDCRSVIQQLSLKNSPALGARDLRSCSALQTLDCTGCGIKALDLTPCVALERLVCSNNRLASLDVSCCPALSRLDCSSNLLESLSTKGCSNLFSVTCVNAFQRIRAAKALK